VEINYMECEYMKNTFEMPECDIIYFESCDIITASGADYRGVDFEELR